MSVAHALQSPFKIANEVVLIPVKDLDAQVRDKFDYNPDDFAIAKNGARGTTKIIDPDTASLVELFREPKTIASGVLEYGQQRGENPKLVLESVFPVLSKLINDRILLPETDEVEQENKILFEEGAEFLDWTIVRNLQVLEDSEVHFIRKEGKFAALKIAKAGGGMRVRRQIENEAKHLMSSQSGVCPSLIEKGKYSTTETDDKGKVIELPYLICEWIYGTELLKVRSEENVKGRAALVLAAIEAYAGLHGDGILHGDVHPGNIFLDREGKVRILDLGLATKLDEEHSRSGRGGVAFFFEPEYAKAILEKTRPPKVSSASEQYAVAVLGYLLLAGNHYLDFSLEPSTMYRQILEEDPKPLADYGIVGKDDIEKVLRRALSKNIDQRYPSMSEFAEAFQAACELDLSEEESKLVANLSARRDSKFGSETKLFQEGIQVAPRASVKFGSAGIAYAFYRMGICEDDPVKLAEADVWVRAALKELDSVEAFSNSENDISKESVGEVSTLHSASGVHLVSALISKAMEDRRGLEESLENFSLTIEKACYELDASLGKSNVLNALVLLGETVFDVDTFKKTKLYSQGREIANELESELLSKAKISESTRSNIGFAHGWSGLIYNYLRWCRYTGEGDIDLIKGRLEEIASFGVPKGRGLSWPWDLARSSDHAMPGWCNGGAGYILLWTEAFLSFKDVSYKELAELAAWQVWEDEATHPNLCCGLVGRAFSLAILGKLLNEPLWASRAEKLGEKASKVFKAGNLGGELDEYTHSLFKGEVGLELLTSELGKPSRLSFPMIA